MKTLSIFATALIAAATLHADVIYTNLENDFDTSEFSSIGNIDGDISARAQAFLPDYGYFVTDVKLALSSNTLVAASPRDFLTINAAPNLKISLYSDNNNKPSQLLATFTTSESIGSSPSIITFVPDEQPLLSVDIQYWLVAEPTNPQDISINYNWYKNGSPTDFESGDTAEGQYSQGTFIGWNTGFITREGGFEINGIPTEVPEPGTIALGAGLAALGLVWIRRCK